MDVCEEEISALVMLCPVDRPSVMAAHWIISAYAPPPGNELISDDLSSILIVHLFKSTFKFSL